jgi:hypothetical protein
MLRQSVPWTAWCNGGIEVMWRRQCNPTRPEVLLHGLVGRDDGCTILRMKILLM